MRSTVAKINLTILQNNFLSIRERVGNVKIMPVVKADGYGHNANECVTALEALGDKKPEYYGVSSLEEAISIRKAEITDNPILTFSQFRIEEVNDYSHNNISVSVTGLSQIDKIKKYELEQPLNVHVNIDTGMGRQGIWYKESISAIEELDKINNLNIEGVYTHFATSDHFDKTYARVQLERFNSILAELKRTKISYGLVHAANSGAIIDMPEAYFDLVRPGIMLYGYTHYKKELSPVNVNPVMSVLSSVYLVKRIKKGQSVSYGQRFFAEEDTNIATVPIGYADGIVRELTNKISCIINNKMFSQVGTITMDYIMIDVKDSDVKEGDDVIIIGESVDFLITAWDWCEILDSIPYTTTCGISKRVPRKFIIDD